MIIDNSGKNKITLGLVDGAGDEYGTVEWTTGKGKSATFNSEPIYPDGSGWYIDAGAGDDTIDASQTALRAEIYGGTGNDTIYGGTFGSSNPYSYGEGDYIDGGAGRDWIDAGAGNDIVVYDAYDQRVEGGSGFDILDASDAPSVRGKGVTIDLGSTRDIFSGFEGIIGSDYADTLTGNEASNAIDGGAGADTIRLGYGEDVVAYDADDILVDGGYDRDTLYGGDFSGPEGITLDLETSTTWKNFEIVIGSEFADTLTGNSQDNNLQGGGGDDVLNGRAGNDFLTGDSGDDIINGEGGNDDIYGGDGVDNLDGGAGNDYLSAGAGDDIIQGGAGSDQIYGEDGADQLNGGTGVDYIYGGYGADVIDGGEGADTVYAGFGDDMVIYDAEGYANGEAGIDTVNASTATGGVSINLNVSYVNFENIIGSAFDDTLVGQDSVTNDFTGGGGADVMTGGSGGDIFNFSDLGFNDSPELDDGYLSSWQVTDEITDFVASGSDLIQLPSAFNGFNYTEYLPPADDLNALKLAADAVLGASEGNPAVYFGVVGSDGYVFFDDNSDGYGTVIKLTGVNNIDSADFLVVPT